MTVDKTYVTKQDDIKRQWFYADAEGQSLGRLASKIAAILRGKHKPIFTPGLDTGDFVVVVNAEKVTVTGNKLTEKFYYRYSGYPGGMTAISLKDQLAKHPDRVIEHAVWGMLPHNKLGRAMLKKLKIYRGSAHPHSAQHPSELK
jgi:large subunit ribosomal protein L13